MSDLHLLSPDAYRSLVEHAPYGIFRSTRTGRILMANPALARILGYEREEEVLDLDLDDEVYVDPEERKRVIDEHDDGHYTDLEARWNRADGAEIIVRLSGRPVFDEEGEFLFFETFVEDVTEERRAEEHLKRVLEDSGAFLFRLRVEDDRAPPFHAVWVSDSVRRILGYSPEEALAPDWFPQGVHPDDRDEVAEVSSSVTESEDLIHEFRFRHRNGSYRWFRQELHLVDAPAGAPSEIVGVWVDVTERKQAELALRKWKKWANRVLEAAGAFLFILVPDGGRFDFAWLSEGVRTLLGYPRREAMQAGWFVTGVHPEDRDEAMSRAARALEGEEVVHEFRFRHRSGGYRWLREELRVLEEGPDGPASLVGVAVDITDQKEAERALREGSERVRSIMNAVPDAVVTIDGEGRIVDLNPAVAEVYGYAPEELVGRPFTVLFPARFREENSRNFQRLISEEGERSFRARRMRGLQRSGQEFSAELSVAQHTVNGEPHITAVFRDVTERRRMEEERTELIDELQTALKEVRTLRGILPVCSSCKKIKDEASGSWERIESYLREHSEAQLSHGICPDCAQQLYGPDFWSDAETTE